jgi:hypothetical protein
MKKQKNFDLSGNLDIADDSVWELQRDKMLQYHLRYNMYPPVPNQFDVAKLAIEMVRSGKGKTIIAESKGKNCTAYEVIEGLHLEDFTNPDSY